MPYDHERKPAVYVGSRYGRLLVCRFVKPSPIATTGWVVECLCDCGNSTLTYTRSLKAGNTQSCGCLRQDRLRSRCAHWVTYLGQTKTKGEWATHYGVHPSMITRRLQRGRNVDGSLR